jgi:Zn-finger protein
MSYLEWFEAHATKHENIMKTLNNLSDDEVIEYFVYENMKEKHIDFCPLYAKNKKCHDIKELNCYLCACNYFRFSDDGLANNSDKTLYSICSINAKDGKTIQNDTAIHQDCSDCLIPHKKSTIKKHFSRSWREIMQHTKTES